MIINGHNAMILDRGVEASIGLPDTIVYVNLSGNKLTITYHRTRDTVLVLRDGKKIGGSL